MAPDAPDTAASGVDVGAYCRQVESYLCQRNGGHLIRLVGPAFQLVAQWAADGVPLRVVQHGIDRTVTRREARGTQRRPVRIEFCEADVLDAFDQWRRAVGPAAGRAVSRQPEVATSAGSARRGPSLASHLERVIMRLSSVRAGTALSPEAGAAVDEVLRRLDAVASQARTARGEQRQALRTELSRIDESLMLAMAAALDADLRARLEARADEELRPMRDRLADDVHREARDRLVRQLLRQELGLPEIEVP